MDYGLIVKELGEDAEEILSHRCTWIPKESLHLPCPDWVDKVLSMSNRSTKVLCNFQRLLGHGSLGNSGYISILPVDQGVEHSAISSFAKNTDYFDPENIAKLAIYGGCNALATTSGIIGAISRKYAHKLPLILKVNHNELLTYPNCYDQVPFSSAKLAFEMGCCAVGATIYFGSQSSKKQIESVSKIFEEAHNFGLVTVLWCYLRNEHFKTKEQDFHLSDDLTGQANYLGATIQADIIKQKMPTCGGGFKALNFPKHLIVPRSDNKRSQIDLVRHQVANNFMGRVPLIHSGGDSGTNDISSAVRAAVINKRGGGSGLIIGRKAFKCSMDDGIKLLHAVQSVYRCEKILAG